MENANNEVKTPKTTKQKVIFGLKIGGNVIFYLVIIFLFLFSLMNINSGGKGGIPNLFGKGMLSVQSDSMERNDIAEDDVPGWENYKIKDIKKNDLVYVDVVSLKSVKSLKVGDVITFYDNRLQALNTHRVVYVNVEENYVIAQGDKVAQMTPFDTTDPAGTYNGQLEIYGDIQHVAANQIKAKVTGVNRGGGKVLDNIQQNWLFYFVIPVLALLLFEVFMVIKNVTDLRNEKAKAALATDKDAMMAEIEAEREKIRQELLKEMGMAPTPTPEETPTEAPVEETSTEEVVEENPVEEVVETTDNTEEVKVEEEETKTE